MTWLHFPTSTGLWLWTVYNSATKTWNDPEPVRVVELADRPNRAWVERFARDHDPNDAILLRADDNERWAPLSLDGYSLPPAPDHASTPVFDVTYEKVEVLRKTFEYAVSTKEEAIKLAAKDIEDVKGVWRFAGSSLRLCHAIRKREGP